MAIRTSTLVLVSFSLIFTSTILLASLALIRLQAILPPNRPKPHKRDRGYASHLMVVLGSGGHTAEMIAMLHKLDPSRHAKRTYVVSSGDGFSKGKAVEFEKDLAKPYEGDNGAKGNVGTYTIITVPRARRIHQSLLTTPISALQCMLSCIILLYRGGYPDIIVTNGPATGCIVVFASVFLRFLNIHGAHSGGKMRTIYVESWARVKSLSLTGYLLQGVVDRFGVQWEDLAEGRREYWGILV